MLDYKDLNDNEKRILREYLHVERMTHYNVFKISNNIYVYKEQ